MKNKESQEMILLRQFKAGRTVSQLEAINELGIGHLSSVVSKMRLKYSIPVQKTMLTSKSGARYAGYYMQPAEAREWMTTLREQRGF